MLLAVQSARWPNADELDTRVKFVKILCSVLCCGVLLVTCEVLLIVGLLTQKGDWTLPQSQSSFWLLQPSIAVPWWPVFVNPFRLTITSVQCQKRRTQKPI